MGEAWQPERKVYDFIISLITCFYIRHEKNHVITHKYSARFGDIFLNIFTKLIIQFFLLA